MSADIRAQLSYVNQQLDAAQQRRAEVEHALAYYQNELDEIRQQESSYQSLALILAQIDELETRGDIKLLWGDAYNDTEAEHNRHRIEAWLEEYKNRIERAEQYISKLKHELAPLVREIGTLLELQQSCEEVISKLPAEAATHPAPAQTQLSPIVLPWSNKRNDALRLRMIMLSAITAAALLGYIVPRWQIPEPERIEKIEIPDRLATLIVKKAPPPPPIQEQLPEQEAEQAETTEPEPEPEQEKSEARKSVEKVGLLAFSQDFAEIMDASSEIKMGSQATIIKTVPGRDSLPAERKLITSRVDFSKTGAGATTVRRTDAIGDKNTLKQVEFTRVESPELAAIDNSQLGAGRTTAKRSDEEIQVVFDRYKDALYRIYNRELRKNSFLKGKLVLQLTIEPDGKVSNCTIKSSDLNSTDLEQKIVARVKRFNFGKKPKASPLTILYPIEFFPAS